MKIEEIEAEVIAKGLTAPRVSARDIDDAIIDGTQFYVFPGTTVTVACVPLKNGYMVVGKSACASIENFDEELGRILAFDDAKRKIWPLLGYALRERIK